MQYSERIHHYEVAHREEIVNTLKELVKIPSVRGKAEFNAPFGTECAKALELTMQMLIACDQVEKSR